MAAANAEAGEVTQDGIALDHDGTFPVISNRPFMLVSCSRHLEGARFRS
jgi:hypothetical protein